jgi:NTE family protein
MDLTNEEIAALGQTVLVLQGGGALGAYQVGVYEALHEAGIEPDWVIGTSIGAINASIIAGSAREQRVDRLREFWRRVEFGHFLPAVARSFVAISSGIPAFFRPNAPAFLSPHLPLGAEEAGYYSVAPLRQTLGELIEVDRLNRGAPRLTLGAANVRTSEMRYFDSRDTPLGLDHVLASGALPPAFPPVRIDGELYWDGGIVSNTPVEAVFDDIPRRDSLVFAVHLWNPHGDEPETIWQVMNRHKDVQYSSRAVSHIQRQRQLHRLRHIVAELSTMVPQEQRRTNRVGEMASMAA